MVSLKKVDNFYRKKKKIPKVILGVTDSHEIIYGARALNKQLPSHLDKQTQDFDIFSPYPKKDAMQTEKALDKSFGGDYFFVEPAKHEGTWKVKSQINKEGYADYTKPENKIPFRTIGGKKYVKLDYVRKHIKKTLKDPEAKYRWDKDRDSLNRIRIYEKLKKQKRKVKQGKKKVFPNLLNFGYNRGDSIIQSNRGDSIIQSSMDIFQKSQSKLKRKKKKKGGYVNPFDFGF